MAGIDLRGGASPSAASGGVQVIGPIHVTYVELGTDGDTLDVYTPAAGDVVTKFFIDAPNAVVWDVTTDPRIAFGDPPDLDAQTWWQQMIPAGPILPDDNFQLDSVSAVGGASSIFPNQVAGNYTGSAGHVCSGSPLQLVYSDPGNLGGTPTQGAFDLYLVVATPVAPS